jgi:ketosteroid isomerase-like protein
VRAFADAFNEQDRDSMVNLLTEDAEWHPVLGTFLTQSVYRGRREVCDLLLQEIPSEIERFRGEVVSVHDARPDAVIVEARLTGVGRSSRVPLEQVFFQLYGFREERLATMHSFPSYEEALEAARAQG